MKTFIAILLLCAVSGASIAQCDQKTNYVSAHSAMVDKSGKVLESRQDTAMIEVTKTDVKISFNNDDRATLTGHIDQQTCNWAEPYKNGKTVIKTVLEDVSGDLKHVVLTIEGKDGKITIIGEAQERPNENVQFVVDKVEQKS